MQDACIEKTWKKHSGFFKLVFNYIVVSLWLGRENLKCIMMTCIILMIVEDVREKDKLEPFDPEDIPTILKKAEIYDRPNSYISSSSCTSSIIIKIMHIIMMYWRFSLLQPRAGPHIIKKRARRISNSPSTFFMYAFCIFVKCYVFGWVEFLMALTKDRNLR